MYLANILESLCRQFSLFICIFEFLNFIIGYFEIKYHVLKIIKWNQAWATKIDKTQLDSVEWLYWQITPANAHILFTSQLSYSDSKANWLARCILMFLFLHLVANSKPGDDVSLLELGEQRLVDAMVQLVQVVEQLLHAGLGRLGLTVDAVVAGLVLFKQPWGATVLGAFFLRGSKKKRGRISRLERHFASTTTNFIQEGACLFRESLAKYLPGGPSEDRQCPLRRPSRSE